MTFYVESGSQRKEVQCGTMIQAAFIFLLTFRRTGLLLMVSQTPFVGRQSCPTDAQFWKTEELREQLSQQPPIHLAATDVDVLDAEREVVEAMVG